MKISGKTAFELLTTNTVFAIPAFQRDYSWQESDCKRLFEDIAERVRDKTVPHFVGTICYKEDEGIVLIVDGQQRITSLMLFLLAIRDMSFNKELQKDIFVNFLTVDGLQSKLKLKTKDMNVYEKLLYQENSIFALSNLTKEDESSYIYKNYNKFYELLYDFVLKNNKFGLEDFLKVLERIEFAVIELQTANPQVIFESLNATGVNLTEVDKIRNYILMPLTGKMQDFIYEKYWRYLETSVGEDMEDFLIAYLTLKNNSDEISGVKITSKTLYFTFKDFSQNHDIVMLLQELCEFEKYYQKLHDNTNQVLNTIFNLLQIKQAMTVCIYLLQKEEKLNCDLSELFELYLSYIIRGKVCERINIKNSHSAYLISETNKAKTSNELIYLFKKTLLQSDGVFKFPSNKEFKEALVNNDVYLSLGSAGTKYLLYEIERAEMFRQQELPPFKEGSIEHIMPQTLTPEWEKYLEKDKFCYIQNLHTLGNLAITRHNSELSNKPFFEKCKIYNTEPYFHTQKVSKTSNWGSQSIKERAKLLADIAIGIWQSIRLEETVITNEVYNIDNISANLARIKPNIASLMGEERLLKSWNDMLYFVVSTLYEFDTVAMLRFMAQTQNNFISNKKPHGANKKIADGVYIKTHGTASQKVENLKKLIKFYDKNSEVNVSNNFWFTI